MGTIKIDKHIESSLRELLNDEYVKGCAVKYLCYFSNKEDLTRILKISNQTDELFQDLAGALISPSKLEEWLYLQKCISYANDTREWWFAVQAALALGATGGEKGLTILRYY